MNTRIHSPTSILLRNVWPARSHYLLTLGFRQSVQFCRGQGLRDWQNRSRLSHPPALRCFLGDTPRPPAGASPLATSVLRKAEAGSDIIAEHAVSAEIVTSWVVGVQYDILSAEPTVERHGVEVSSVGAVRSPNPVSLSASPAFSAVLSWLRRYGDGRSDTNASTSDAVPQRTTLLANCSRWRDVEARLLLPSLSGTTAITSESL